MLRITYTMTFNSSMIISLLRPATLLANILNFEYISDIDMEYFASSISISDLACGLGYSVYCVLL